MWFLKILSFILLKQNKNIKAHLTSLLAEHLHHVRYLLKLLSLFAFLAAMCCLESWEYDFSLPNKTTHEKLLKCRQPLPLQDSGRLTLHDSDLSMESKNHHGSSVLVGSDMTGGSVCVWAAPRALGQVEAPCYGGGRHMVWSKLESSWEDSGLSSYSPLWVLPVTHIFLLCFTFVLRRTWQNVETINHILERNEEQAVEGGEWKGWRKEEEKSK